MAVSRIGMDGAPRIIVRLNPRTQLTINTVQQYNIVSSLILTVSNRTAFCGMYYFVLYNGSATQSTLATIVPAASLVISKDTGKLVVQNLDNTYSVNLHFIGFHDGTGASTMTVESVPST